MGQGLGDLLTRWAVWLSLEDDVLTMFREMLVQNRATLFLKI